MKIAFDHQIFFQQRYGGISRYFARLADALLDIGEDVRVYAPVHCNQYLQQIPSSAIIGCMKETYPAYTRRLISLINKVSVNAGLRLWKPTFLHETYYDKTQFGAYIYPTVTTVHDMIPEIFPIETKGNNLIALKKRAAIARAAHVICVSESTRQDLIRLCGIPEHKVTVVHHGYDQFDVTADYDTSALATVRPYILFVGQRGGYKNFSALLRAVSLSPSLRSDFDIVAFGGVEFASEEMDYIASLGFDTERVRHDSGGDAKLGAYYRSANLFVYPSKYEGFGFPLLEAMAHACPVVCSNTSSMPEVGGSAAVYFDPADVDDMRQAIENVIYSKPMIELLRMAGKERLKEFSWERCARETLCAYRLLE